MDEGTRGATSAQIGAVAEEVPSSHLPPVTYQDLPDPLPLRKVLGPGVVSIGIGVSSGELIIWPFITSQIGLIFLWAAVIGVLRRIYNTVRGHVGGKGTKGLEEKDEHLWKLVQDMGGPPEQHGSKGRFWQTVQEAMNRIYPGRYTTSKGVQQRYFNILERLRPPRND